jgi:hypothetical protein
MCEQGGERYEEKTEKWKRKKRRENSSDEN